MSEEQKPSSPPNSATAEVVDAGNSSSFDRIAMRMSVAQTTLAVVGFLVGLIALYAALNEADAVRKQQQASVWPYVDVSVSKNNVPGDRFFEVTLANKGIGPARIRRVEVFVDGEPQSNWWAVTNKAAVLEGQTLLLSNANVTGTVLSAGESKMLMRADATSLNAEDGIDYNELLNRLGGAADAGRFKMAICYCSVFDDCWQRDTAIPGEATPVDFCPQQPDGIVY